MAQKLQSVETESTQAAKPVWYVDNTKTEGEYTQEELIALLTGEAVPMWKPSVREYVENGVFDESLWLSDHLPLRFDEESWDYLSQHPEEIEGNDFSEYSCLIPQWQNFYSTVSNRGCSTRTQRKISIGTQRKRTISLC